MSPVPAETIDQKPHTIDASAMDLTLLAGQVVTIYAEQFSGEPLTARIALANERELFLNRSDATPSLENLVPNQRVVLRVTYKGEPLHLLAVLQRVDNGQVRLVLGRKLVPLARRQFVRIIYHSPVQVAVISTATFRRDRLNRLRWLETETENLSGGGALIRFSGILMNPTYLLFHLETSDFLFPALLLAQVLYSLPKTDSSFLIGVEFITREVQARQFPPVTLKELPAPVRTYVEQTRTDLNNQIKQWLNKDGTRGA